MNPDTILYVTPVCSIMLPSGKVAIPGTALRAGDFVKHQAQLKILLEAGRLSLSPTEQVSIDVKRVEEPAPALPHEIDLRTGAGAPRSVAGSRANDAATMARVEEIKRAKAAREKTLAEVGADTVLTPEEAQALGLVK